MSTFRREFDVDRVKDVLHAPENAWFKDLLRYWCPGGNQIGVFNAQKSPVLRLAIRDGYLNFYRAGQSIAYVKIVKNGLQWKIHNKYVYGPDKGKGQKSVCVEGGRFTDQDGSVVDYRTDLLDGWIGNANGYMHRHREKRFVDELVAYEAGAIDLEAALPADPAIWPVPPGKKRPSAKRMDLVTLEPDGGHYELAFWEVKLVENNEARCEDANNLPEVVGQLKRYEMWLAKNRPFVCDAYRRCCSDLVKLHRIAKEVNPAIPELGEAILAVGQGSARLSCDGTLRLIIDARKKEGVFSDHGHLKKLQGLGISVRMVRTSADLVMSAHA